jgi:zinc protease
MEIQLISKTLSNGLDVFAYEDHRTPTFSFVIYYNVGSMDEHPGITGASHIIEHMVFKGSDKIDGNELNLMTRRHGGYLNAATNEDKTGFFVTMPISEIEYPLLVWSDLMTNANFNPDDFSSEREVIIEERRLQVEDDPVGSLYEALKAVCFWAHPYRIPVVGWMSDLQSIQRDDIYRYYKTYYRPDNAVIIATGDADEKRILELIEKYFGNIGKASGNIPRSGTIEPPQTGLRRATIRKPAELPIVMIGFHSPSLKDQMVYPLLIAEKILSYGESSRIYRNIIHENRLATMAGGLYEYLTRDPSLFILYAQASPDRNAETVEKALWDEVDKITSGEITHEEIEKAKNIVEAQFIYQQERNLSEARTKGEFFLAADMDTYDHFVEKLGEVRKDEIIDSCRIVFDRNNASVVDLEPTKGNSFSATAITDPDIQNYTRFYHYKDNSPVSAKMPDGIPYWNDADKFTLSNGIRVVTYHRDNLPIFNINCFFQAGAAFDPDGKAGLATLTGNMLKAGTISRNTSEIAEEIERVGGNFDIGVSRETLFTGMQFLSRHYKTALDILSECLTYPSFLEEEVQRYKELQSGEIKSVEDNVWVLAPREFVRNLYAGSPYGYPVMGDLASVDSIAHSHVVGFHQNQITGSNAIMSVTGDFNRKTIRDELEFYFAKIPQGTPSDLPEHTAVEITKPTVNFYHKDIQQCSIVTGNYSFSRTHDDYFPFLLLDLIFGGDSITSRIGDVIREKLGLAYFIQSSFHPMKKTGFWITLLQTKSENVTRVLDVIRSEIRKIRDEEISDDEIRDAKSSFRGRSALEIESNNGLAMKLLTVLYYDLGDDYLSSFFKKIDSVTKSQIRAVAQKYLDPDRFLITIVGDQTKTKVQI